jgi:hypothetical protein
MRFPSKPREFRETDIAAYKAKTDKNHEEPGKEMAIRAELRIAEE